MGIDGDRSGGPFVLKRPAAGLMRRHITHVHRQKCRPQGRTKHSTTIGSISTPLSPIHTLPPHIAERNQTIRWNNHQSETPARNSAPLDSTSYQDSAIVSHCTDTPRLNIHRIDITGSSEQASSSLRFAAGSRSPRGSSEVSARYHSTSHYLRFMHHASSDLFLRQFVSSPIPITIPSILSKADRRSGYQNRRLSNRTSTLCTV